MKKLIYVIAAIVLASCGGGGNSKSPMNRRMKHSGSAILKK